MNLQSGLASQTRPQTFRLVRAPEAVRWCLPQAVVSHWKDNVEITEAFRFVVVDMFHRLLDTRCWIISPGCWILVFSDAVFSASSYLKRLPSSILAILGIALSSLHLRTIIPRHPGNVAVICKTEIAVVTDNNMFVHGDSHYPAGKHKLAGNGNIFGRRLWIP